MPSNNGHFIRGGLAVEVEDSSGSLPTNGQVE